MGLFDKLKNILFEEEEVEIPVITKKTEEEPRDIREQRRSNNYSTRFEDTEEITIEKPSSRDNISRFRNVKRDIEVNTSSYDDEKTEEIPISVEEQIQEKSSPFLSFDEDEFERLNSRIKDNEEKQEKEKQNKEKQKPKKNEEPKRPDAPRKFKPSPVISPVYGILDKNYKKEDIIEKGVEPVTILEEVSVESVRKKAFGTLVDDIESSLGEEKVLPREEFTDERSIDEILTESIDETISIDEDIEIPIINTEDTRVEDLIEEETIAEEPTIDEEIEDSIVSFEEEAPLQDEEEIELPSFEALNNEVEEDEGAKENENSLLEKTDTIKMLDEIEDELDDVKVNKELLEDTTETDLFNLIDSMYENREEDN